MAWEPHTSRLSRPPPPPFLFLHLLLLLLLRLLFLLFIFYCFFSSSSFPSSLPTLLPLSLFCFSSSSPSSPSPPAVTSSALGVCGRPKWCGRRICAKKGGRKRGRKKEKKGRIMFDRVRLCNVKSRVYHVGVGAKTKKKRVNKKKSEGEKKDFCHACRDIKIIIHVHFLDRVSRASTRPAASHEAPSSPPSSPPAPITIAVST